MFAGYVGGRTLFAYEMPKCYSRTSHNNTKSPARLQRDETSLALLLEIERANDTASSFVIAYIHVWIVILFHVCYITADAIVRAHRKFRS